MVGLRLGNGVEAVTVSCDGYEDLVPHLPAATADRLLSNLSRMRADQVDLFTRFEAMVGEALTRVRGEERQPTFTGMPLVEHDARPPDAIVVIEVLGRYDKQQLGATLKFKPFFRAQSPRIAEAALWSVWDWTVGWMPSIDDYEAMLVNLSHQCDYYRESGFPGARNIGRAAFYGAMKGAGERVERDADV